MNLEHKTKAIFVLYIFLNVRSHFSFFAFAVFVFNPLPFFFHSSRLMPPALSYSSSSPPFFFYSDLASMAGLEFECRSDEGGGVTIRCWGFAEKTPLLLTEALKTLISLMTVSTSTSSTSTSTPAVTMSPKRFEACKELVGKRYLNGFLKVVRNDTRYYVWGCF
jgi:hypothetical protein